MHLSPVHNLQPSKFQIEWKQIAWKQNEWEAFDCLDFCRFRDFAIFLFPSLTLINPCVWCNGSELIIASPSDQSQALCSELICQEKSEMLFGSESVSPVRQCWTSCESPLSVDLLFHYKSLSDQFRQKIGTAMHINYVPKQIKVCLSRATLCRASRFSISSALSLLSQDGDSHLLGSTILWTWGLIRDENWVSMIVKPWT